MAGARADRISTTAGGPAVWGGSRSPREGSRRRGHEGTLNAKTSKERKEEPEENVLPPTLTVVIEQWVCLVLGIACVVSGIVGIGTNPSQSDLSAGFPCLKSIYVPLLRITAAACFAFGVVLVRLGCASNDRTQRRVLNEQTQEAAYER